MRTRVKICGLTNPEDAAVVAAAGADALGLVFYPPSPRAVSLEQAQSICANTPAFVTITALFVDATVAEVQKVLRAVPVQLLQFHGDEPAEYCESFGLPYIKAIRVQSDTDWDALLLHYQSAAGLLLDTYKPNVPGGTGEAFNWDLIPLELRNKIILAGGLTPDNVASAVATVKPYAVDVSGGVESAKGVKDKQLIMQFLHEVCCANDRL